MCAPRGAQRVRRDARLGHKNHVAGETLGTGQSRIAGHGAQHHELIGVACDQMTTGVQAVHAREHDVNQNDVGDYGGQPVESFLTTVRFTGQLKVGARRDHVAECITKYVAVIDDEDANRHYLRLVSTFERRRRALSRAASNRLTSKPAAASRRTWRLYGPTVTWRRS